MEIDAVSYEFASLFLHDSQQPKGKRRTRWKVHGETKDGLAIHIVDLFIDGEKVVTHRIIDHADGRQPLWREFVEKFIYDCMGVKAASLLEEDPPKSEINWPGDR